VRSSTSNLHTLLNSWASISLAVSRARDDAQSGHNTAGTRHMHTAATPRSDMPRLRTGGTPDHVTRRGQRATRARSTRAPRRAPSRNAATHHAAVLVVTVPRHVAVPAPTPDAFDTSRRIDRSTYHAATPSRHAPHHHDTRPFPPSPRPHTHRQTAPRARHNTPPTRLQRPPVRPRAVRRATIANRSTRHAMPRPRDASPTAHRRPSHSNTTRTPQNARCTYTPCSQPLRAAAPRHRNAHRRPPVRVGRRQCTSAGSLYTLTPFELPPREMLARRFDFL